MARPLATIHRRRMTGRKKSRVRVGPWPWIVFIVICLLAAVIGTKVEEAFRIWEVTHAPKVQASPNATPAEH